MLLTNPTKNWLTDRKPIGAYISSNVPPFGGGHGLDFGMGRQPLPNSMEVDAAKVAFESFGEVGQFTMPSWPVVFFADEENQEVTFLRETEDL